MGTRRNFGVTVNDDRWEAFVRKAIEAGSFELRVGILRAGTKYPAGHVGRKSRDADSGDRLKALAGGAREKSMLSAYRLKKATAKGKGRSFKRKARRKRVDVVKVAAVVGYEAGKRPKLPGMWMKSMDRADQFVHRQAKIAISSALKGASGRRAIEAIGARLKAAYKADVLRAGHRDTGLLLNAINWEMVDVDAQDAARALARSKRAARKAAKAAL